MLTYNAYAIRFEKEVPIIAIIFCKGLWYNRLIETIETTENKGVVILMQYYNFS